MARAGTQWLTRSLNSHPQVAAFGETMFWGRRFVPPHPDGRYDAEDLETLADVMMSHGTCLLSVLGDDAGCLRNTRREDVPDVVHSAIASAGTRPRPVEVFHSLAAELLERERKLIAVEKTPHHLNWIDRILAAIPEARFVVMVREPYSFLLSYKHQGDRLPDRVRRSFRRRYHPFGAALVWKRSWMTAHSIASRYPDSIMLVNFSELKENTEVLLDTVQDFFDIPRVDLSDAVPPDNTSFPGAARPRLRGDDVFWLHLVAGKTMRAGGLSMTRHSTDFWRTLSSVLRFPIWATWNFFSLRKRTQGSTLGYLLRWLRPARGSA